MWEDWESAKSSTWRELQAILFSVQSLECLINNSYVKWFTDNQAAAKIVEVGSMKEDLHALAIAIFRHCITCNIRQDIEWIPRTENQIADAISRFIDIDDWQISIKFFQEIQARWGYHTIDCFANFQGSGTPGLAALTFLPNLYQEKIAWSPRLFRKWRELFIICTCNGPSERMWYLFGHLQPSGT